MTLASPFIAAHSSIVAENQFGVVLKSYRDQGKPHGPLQGSNQQGAVTGAAGAVSAFSGPAFALAWGQTGQLVEQVPARAWSMIALIVRAQRPHWALQPRHPYTCPVVRGFAVWQAVRMALSVRTLHEQTIIGGAVSTKDSSN